MFPNCNVALCHGLAQGMERSRTSTWNPPPLVRRTTRAKECTFQEADMARQQKYSQSLMAAALVGPSGSWMDGQPRWPTLPALPRGRHWGYGAIWFRRPGRFSKLTLWVTSRFIRALASFWYHPGRSSRSWPEWGCFHGKSQSMPKIVPKKGCYRVPGNNPVSRTRLLVPKAVAALK